MLFLVNDFLLYTKSHHYTKIFWIYFKMPQYLKIFTSHDRICFQFSERNSACYEYTQVKYLESVCVVSFYVWSLYLYVKATCYSSAVLFKHVQQYKLKYETQMWLKGFRFLSYHKESWLRKLRISFCSIFLALLVLFGNMWHWSWFLVSISWFCWTDSYSCMQNNFKIKFVCWPCKG